MNYITAINSFWYSATMNPLSTGQIALWFALMHINNGCNWTEWFQAPNQVLSVLTGMSRSGILKARNELKQRGLIDFRERGTKTTLYTITIVNSKQVSVQDSKQNSEQVGTQDGVQDSMQDIYIKDIVIPLYPPRHTLIASWQPIHSQTSRYTHIRLRLHWSAR